jgi:putative Mg2+ transporter-C (MgtC) family protein
MNGFLAAIPAGGTAYSAARAAVALALGAVIGLERQWRQRTAGLRTNALVALGAALFRAVLDTAERATRR